MSPSCAWSSGSSPPARGTRVATFVLINFMMTVHPRPRGEHFVAPHRPHVPTGSSPPARGTRETTTGVASERDRFIPARAGNTPLRPCWQRPSFIPDPRHFGPREFSLGSSPPARGTPDDCRGGDGALAGSSPPARGTRRRRVSRTAYQSVHPRPRGEHTTTRALTGRRDLRFIPARAGNTAGPMGPDARLGDGSSPPARGTRKFNSLENHWNRSSPPM